MRGLPFALLLPVAALAQQPARIHVEAAVSRIIVGERLQFRATARNANGDLMPNVPLTWSSTNARVASVDSSGMVTASDLGFAQIAAQSGNVRGAIELQMIPLRIEVDPPDREMTVGDSQQFTARALNINGEPIPNVAFTWQVLGANAGQINAAIISRDGMLETRGTARVSVRAQFNYPFAPGRIEQIWGSATVNIRAARQFRVRRLLSSADVRHQFQLRNARNVALNESGHAAFVASLDGLADSVMIHDGSLQPAAAGENFSDCQLAINARADVAGICNTFTSPSLLVLFSAGRRQTLLVSGAQTGGFAGFSPSRLSRNSLNIHRDLLLEASHRPPGSSVNQPGLFRLLGGTRIELVSSADISEFGHADNGDVFFISRPSPSSNETSLFRWRGEAPEKILAPGDSFAGSRVVRVHNLAVASTGEAAALANLASGATQILRIAGSLAASPVPGCCVNIQSVDRSAVLFTGQGQAGFGLYRWQPGSQHASLVSLGAIAPNGEPLTQIYSARWTSSGDAIVHAETAENRFVLFRTAGRGSLLAQAGLPVQTDANLNLPFSGTLIPGLRAGPVLLRLGNPSSIFELDTGLLTPRLLHGDTLPATGFLGPGSAFGNSAGDLFFDNGNGIVRFRAGQLERIIVQHAEIEPGVVLNQLQLLAVNDSGAVVFVTPFSGNPQRLYLWDSGRFTLLWRAGQDIGAPIDRWNELALDSNGRILATVSHQGPFSALLAWQGGRWQTLLSRADRMFAGRQLGNINFIIARGDRFYLNIAGQLADYDGAALRPALTEGANFPDGGQFQNLSRFDANLRGDTAVASNRNFGGGSSLEFNTGGAFRSIHLPFAQTEEGDLLVSFWEVQLREDGRIFFGATDVMGRYGLYVAEPLN